MLRVVDISSNQGYISPGQLDCDAVIVKVSGGTSYVNDRAHGAKRDWREWADEVLASGKHLGLYHYCMENGHYNEAADEARFFLNLVADYRGRFVPALDVEADALDLRDSWYREWLEAVESETGATPLFYTGGGFANARDHSEVSRYPLWMASYLYRYENVGWIDSPVNSWPPGSWDSVTLYQYTSTGRIGGYDGDLDLSVFYGDRADWERLQGGSCGKVELGPKAAAIHRFMCDHEGFGYSWAERYGGPDAVEFDGVTLSVGDYDCSSSTITAWQKALEGTPYAGCLGDATYTGNMRSVFCASGLFEWVDVSQAQVGDLYLNEQCHVAMCQGGGELSEFSSSETGGIYGERGDQTGWESHVTGYYDYPWDGCLHYNGKADTASATNRKRGRKMECLIRPNGEDYMVYFDGTKAHPLTHPDEMTAIQEVFRKCYGYDMPCFEYGDKGAPWATRLFEGASREFE